MTNCATIFRVVLFLCCRTVFRFYRRAVFRLYRLYRLYSVSLAVQVHSAGQPSIQNPPFPLLRFLRPQRPTPSAARSTRPRPWSQVATVQFH